MLTLILLVVLGGAVGLLAVSLAEGKPAMNGTRSRRAPDAVPPDGGSDTSGAESPPEPRSDTAAEQTLTATVIAAVAAPPEPERHPTPTRRPGSTSPPRRRSRGDVPRAQTAVEGRLSDLVRPSVPRRVVSLLGIVVITAVVGVGIAALLGAAVGATAEILSNAIG